MGANVARPKLGFAKCGKHLQVGVGLALYTIGSRAIPAAELALLSMTEVLLGPLWVWVVLGEKGGVFTLIGGAILLTGVVSNAVSGIRRKPVPTV